MEDTAEFLKAQLEKPPEDSKKWRMAMIGLKGVAGFTFMGFVLFFLRPSLAAQISTLVQVALAAWGGVVSIYLGAQGSVEFKATSALQSVQENRDIHVDPAPEHMTINIDPKDVDDEHNDEHDR